jgi:poly [ADP-ribose] polymerase
MFGDGLYFSDQSTKALNYATNFWRGGGSTRRIFMFLADVAMGKPYTPSGWGRDFPRRGYDSTFAKGGVSSVSNNEMIVYETNKANLKYLIEFE